MGYKTIWVAESHFSSEVQKQHKSPVIPNYHGEVGLNADSCQLAQLIFAQTTSIGFGTAIFNIVGGNGGPIAAADRIRSLAFLNTLQPIPRKLHIGVAAGRFPYINSPFGIVPRNHTEEVFWPQYQRLIFLEALEIFLRLSNGETLSSADVTPRVINEALFKSTDEFASAVGKLPKDSLKLQTIDYKSRWVFESLKLVPELASAEWKHFLNFVLGSHDPLARDLALTHADVDIFNLSFTPPEQLNKIHEEMFTRYQASGKKWQRGRLPRTVLVFIDRDLHKAEQRANHCFDTYIEAMRGTVVLPPKAELMPRALVGTPDMICAQLEPGHQKDFHREDRLMLWFEFNQVDQQSILAQMRLFMEEVAHKYVT